MSEPGAGPRPPVLYPKWRPPVGPPPGGPHPISGPNMASCTLSYTGIRSTAGLSAFLSVRFCSSNAAGLCEVYSLQEARLIEVEASIVLLSR